MCVCVGGGCMWEEGRFLYLGGDQIEISDISDFVGTRGQGKQLFTKPAAFI